MSPIPGKTFPVKEALKAIGAKWNKEKSAWFIDDSKLAEAMEIVNPSKRIYSVNRWINAGPVFVKAASKKEALEYAMEHPPLKEEKDWCHVWDMWINHRYVKAELAAKYQDNKTLSGVSVVPTIAQQMSKNQFAGCTWKKVFAPVNVVEI